MPLVFAWPAVQFNLPGVHDAVMRSLVGGTAVAASAAPRFNWPEARRRGRDLAQALGRQQGFTVEADMNPGIDRKDRHLAPWLPLKPGHDRPIWPIVGAVPRWQRRAGQPVAAEWPEQPDHHRQLVHGVAHRSCLRLAPPAVGQRHGTAGDDAVDDGVILWTRKRSARAMRWFHARPQPEIGAEAA